MNKKKRALALGLAATQLTALSAVVAPLTAFAEDEPGKTEGVTEGTIVTGVSSLLDASLGTIEQAKNDTNTYLFEVPGDYNDLPGTPTQPSYKAFGLKLTAENTDNIAFFCEDYSLDSAEKSGNIKSDGIDLWVSARQAKAFTFEIRKYKSAVTYKNGFFYITVEGNEVQLTDANGFISNVEAECTTQTITIARKRNLIPTFSGEIPDSVEVPANATVTDAEAAVLEAVGEIGWSEPNVGNNQNAFPALRPNDNTDLSFESGKGYYTIKVENYGRETRGAGEGPAAPISVFANYRVSIELDLDDPRLDFADDQALKDLEEKGWGRPYTGSENYQKKTLCKIIEVKGPANRTTVTVDKTDITSNSDKVTYTLKTEDGTDVTAETLVKEGDKLTLTVTVDDEYEVDGALTVKLGDNTLSETDGVYEITIPEIETDGEELTVTIAGTVIKSKTATITSPTVTGATVTFTKQDGTALPAVLKAGDSVKVTVTPTEGYELTASPTVIFSASNLADTTVNLTSGTGTFTVPPLTAETTAFTVTVTGVKALPTITVGEPVKATNDNPSSMQGAADATKLANYKHNLNKYEIASFTTEGNASTVTINAQRGAMKGKDELSTDGKNVLIIVPLDVTMDEAAGEELEVYKDATKIPDASWLTDADKFITTESGKKYVTLWISLSDSRMANTDSSMTYKFKVGSVEKTLAVKFADTTTYTLVKDAGLTETDFTVTPGTVTNGKATVTVAPVDGKVITAASITITGGTVTLTPDGTGKYTGEVDVKKLISSADVEAGETEAKITNSNLSVTTVAQSDIAATNITVAVAEPETMTGTELDRYKANRALYAASVTWTAAGKTATVKVPSKLMSGANTSGTTGANVCLVMELDGTVAYSSLSGSQFDAIDVTDGSKFVSNAADGKTYVVLWINAHNGALASGSKVVNFEDSDGKIIATVNLVDVPSLEASDVTVSSRVNLTDVEDADAAIIAAVKTALGANADNVDITVGEIPEAEGNGDVTVTIKAKSGADLVLGAAEGSYKKIVETLEITVPVNVPAAPTKYEITKADATNGSFTVTPTTAAEGEAVSIAASPASGYVLDKITVTKTDDSETTVTMKTATTFEMPAYDVTVTVTFKKSSSGSSSSGGGSSRPSGGSSRPSGGGSSSSSVDISSTISAAAKGSTITVPSGKLNLTASELDAATKNDVTIIVPVNSTYSWTVRPSALPTIGAGLTLAVSEGQTVSQLEIIKIKGEPITNIMSFKTYANNLGDAAKLTVTTPVKSTTSQTKFANLYRIADNGALEFVEVVKIDAEGKAVLPMKDSGKYALLVSNESKMPGDINNDCTLNVTDAVTTIDRILNNIQNSEGDLAKLDLNGDGAVNVLDAVIIVNTILGKN